jgi:hypothetical protein
MANLPTGGWNENGGIVAVHNETNRGHRTSRLCFKQQNLRVLVEMHKPKFNMGITISVFLASSCFVHILMLIMKR